MAISGVTLLVRNLEQAKLFFIEKLGFVVRADQTFDNGFRWLTLSPHVGAETAIILSLADHTNQHLVGQQVGNGVLMVLLTEDFDTKYAHMSANGVVFDEAPRSEVYGKVVIFRDIYGNRWDLLQPAEPV